MISSAYATPNQLTPQAVRTVSKTIIVMSSSLSLPESTKCPSPTQGGKYSNDEYQSSIEDESSQYYERGSLHAAVAPVFHLFRISKYMTQSRKQTYRELRQQTFETYIYSLRMFHLAVFQS